MEYKANKPLTCFYSLDTIVLKDANMGALVKVHMVVEAGSWGGGGGAWLGQREISSDII